MKTAIAKREDKMAIEYIDREKAKRLLHIEYAYAAEQLLDEIPAADVAPVVHGQWEWLGPNRLVADCMCGTCSACKVRCKYIVNTMLCPNCGAIMGGVE